MSQRPELTYDGRGINGPDEYRSRVATFSQSLTDEQMKRYGNLFAAAPDMAKFIIGMLTVLDGGNSYRIFPNDEEHHFMRELAQRLKP